MITVLLVGAILAAIAVSDFFFAFAFAQFVTSFRAKRTALTFFTVTSALWVITMIWCSLSYLVALELLSIVPGYENTPLLFRVLVLGALGMAVFWPTSAGFTRGLRREEG